MMNMSVKMCELQFQQASLGRIKCLKPRGRRDGQSIRNCQPQQIAEGTKGFRCRNMSSSNIQRLAGFSIYAAGQCRILGVLKRERHPRHCSLGGNSQHVCVASRIVIRAEEAVQFAMHDGADKIRQGGWSALARRGCLNRPDLCLLREDFSLERATDQ